MSERFKELVLKTSDSERGRGFESHLLRQEKHNIVELNSRVVLLFYMIKL